MGREESKKDYLVLYRGLCDQAARLNGIVSRCRPDFRDEEFPYDQAYEKLLEFLQEDIRLLHHLKASLSNQEKRE